MPAYSSFPGFIIKSTTISVDYWPKQNNSNITHYFLTHAHKDHTRNLDSSWTGPSFYCSQMTKKLIKEINEVADEYAIALDLGMTHIMNLGENETFNVTLLEANHCPGAVMYLFEGYFGNILATGDFRYCPEMFIDTPLITHKIDICYLDNTYFNKQFKNIPSRSDASKEIIALICLKREQVRNVVFHLNLKILGKENLLIDLYDHFKVPILVSEKRYERLVNIIQLNSECFTTKCQDSTLIFVTDNNEEMPNFGEYKNIIYIEPSALNIPHSDRSSAENIDQLYADPNDRFFIVPYTDHSSYDEIVEFVQKLKPKQIVPIVRKPLPGNIEIADISELSVYLNKEPVVDCHEKYRILLRNTAVLRRSSRRNPSKQAVKTNNTYHLVRNLKITKKFKNHIEYESQSSQSQHEIEIKCDLNEKSKNDDTMSIIQEESNSNDNSTSDKTKKKNQILIRKSLRLNSNQKSNFFAIKNEPEEADTKSKWRKLNDQVDVIEEESDSKNNSSIVKELVENQDTDNDADPFNSSQTKVISNDKVSKSNSSKSITNSASNSNINIDDDFITPMTSPVRNTDVENDQTDKDNQQKTPINDNKEKSANSIILDFTLSDNIEAHKFDANKRIEKTIPNDLEKSKIPLNEFFKKKSSEQEDFNFCEAMQKSFNKSGFTMDEKNLKKDIIQYIFESFTF